LVPAKLTFTWPASAHSFGEMVESSIGVVPEVTSMESAEEVEERPRAIRVVSPRNSRNVLDILIRSSPRRPPW
jgi:hypothetical protein